MKKNQVIQLEPKERILAKARNYVESVESFLEEGDQAIPLLLKALRYADRDLKREIMLVLGSFAKEKTVWPLYDIMTDPLQDEEVRQDAAIQLSVIAPFLKKDRQALFDRLAEETTNSDAERRLHATFAMGWEGNSQAAMALIERLYDSDPRVQQTAVNALCNLRDDRILDLLVDRLNNGSLEQKKIILFNLWRFYSKQEEVTKIYLKCLHDDNPEIRFDALVCMGPITEVRDHLEIYRGCLRDKDARIRELALKRLSEEAAESVLKSLRKDVEPLLDDPDMKIKSAALKILKKTKDG
ncbi:MAG TPA: HEAT repeat domain-containing protein [Candidatus Binatia bacterium]